MRLWLGLFAFVAACGGASQSDVFGEPSPTGPQTTDPPAGTTPPAGTGTTPPVGTTPTPGPTPCATTTYYRDKDGDGVGGASAQVACTSPGKEWVTKNGDCEDDNQNVFPGQTAYFGVSYTKSSGGAHSFDYDCSAKEDQLPPLRKVAATCTLVGSACTGEGVVPVPRSGAGTDPLCGATEYQTCIRSPNPGLGQCDAKITPLLAPVACR